LGKSEWRQKTIRFLESHKYHTDYCRLLLDSTKQKNLEEVKSKALKSDIKANKPATITADEPAATASDPAEPEKKKKNKDRPERGIETMFRISSSNHQRLSDMADKKAHIMITVNSIILSAVISLVLRRLD